MLGMFEVFGRTGPQNLGGGAILDPTKINLPHFERLWCLYGVSCQLIDVYTRFDLSLDWLSFCHSLQCWPKNQKCCNQMRLASMQYSKIRLRSGLWPGPRWGAYSAPHTPMAALQGRPGGPWSTLNFGWVGHNAFGPTNNWSVYSLIIFLLL